MTFIAAVPTGYSQGQRIRLDSEQAVDRLIGLLTLPEVHDTTVQGDDDEAVVLDVHVAHGFGYLAYYGEELSGHSVGDPASPELSEESEAGWPRGSGVPMETFRAALLEFVRSRGQAPTVLRWQSLD